MRIREMAYPSPAWYSGLKSEVAIVTNLPEFLALYPGGQIRLAGHRIALEHVMERYSEGYSAEMLCEQYPSLSLALVHKTIAFYWERQSEVEDYLSRIRADLETQRRLASKGPSCSELRQRLGAKRRTGIA